VGANEQAVQSDEKACALFKQAAEQENAVAQYHLGRMYLQGRYVGANGQVVQSDKQASKLFKQAAEQGFAEAQQSLGKMYLDGRYVGANGQAVQSDKQASKLFKQAAEQGIAGALNNLGTMYLDGHYVGANGQAVQSDKQASKLFQQAAEQGIAGALNNLGTMYLDGRYVGANGQAVQSDKQASKLFKQAAEQGSTEAQNLLGLMYVEGLYVEKGQAVQSDAKASTLFKQAAEQGLAQAQYSLGKMYLEGRYVGANGQAVQSDAKASKLFQQAAEQGLAQAQYSLGKMCLEGRYVGANGQAVQSDAKASKLFKQATDQGSTEAQNYLEAIHQQDRSEDMEVTVEVKMQTGQVFEQSVPEQESVVQSSSASHPTPWASSLILMLPFLKAPQPSYRTQSSTIPSETLYRDHQIIQFWQQSQGQSRTFSYEMETAFQGSEVALCSGEQCDPPVCAIAIEIDQKASYSASQDAIYQTEGSTDISVVCTKEQWRIALQDVKERLPSYESLQNKEALQSGFKGGLQQGFVHGYLKGLFSNQGMSEQEATLAAEGATAAMIAAVSPLSAAVYIGLRHVPLGETLDPYRQHISQGVTQLTTYFSSTSLVQTLFSVVGSVAGHYVGNKAGHYAGNKTEQVLAR